jgi:glycosyltransferase involved in cell wall biosynthesis
LAAEVTDGASAARRPHLLYVAWGYPPCRGGGVYRALETANAFARAGWDVTVLTAEREVFLRYTGIDASLESRIDPRIDVVRIPFSWSGLENDIRKYSWLRVRFPRIWRRVRAKLDLKAFPESGYGPWRHPLEEAADRVHSEHPVDLVLATANPHVAFTAAWHLHRRGVPYVLDYRDAWLLDVFDGGRLHGTNSRAARWEAKLVAAAQEVWFVNEPIREWHARLYPDAANRLHVVANGFDESPAQPDLQRHRDKGQPLVFGYVGTVSPKVPLATFVDGWRLARERDPALAEAETHVHGYLGYFHTPRPDLMALIDHASDVGISYRGPVGKTQVHDVYDGFDALLLLLGTGRYVTSGKVFEYVSTGLPVVSVHDPGNAASDVLRGYPLWFPVARLDAESVAAALADAARAVLAADPELRAQALAFAEQYRRERQLSPRIAALAAVLADRTERTVAR